MARSGFGWLAVVVLLNALAACHSAGPLPPTAAPRRVDLTGRLQLVDATPVPGARLVITCGTSEVRVTTDAQGQFTLRGLPEGRCRATCPEAGVDQEVRASANLIGRAAGLDLVLTVPPVHRIRVETTGGVWEIDESLADWTPPALREGKVLERTARAWMPLPFRGAPRGGEVRRLPLIAPDRSLTTLDLSAPRTVVYLVPCTKGAPKIVDRLKRLVQSRPATGLRGVAIQPRPCRPSATPPLHALAGGPELLWALQASPGQIVVLDRGGAVLHRGTLEQAVAHLEQSWPPFTAARQVSVQPAASVRDAETRRLYSRASEQVQARRYAEAHGLLDQTLQLDPKHAEARRERAILKARLGDISGAMREVSWWRSSFGEESAEDLLDEIQRVTASR